MAHWFGGDEMNEPLSNFQAAVAEQAAEEARLAVAPYLDRREKLLAALGKVDVKDDEDLKRTIDKIVLSKRLREEADARLMPIGRPYSDASAAIRNVADGFLADLQRAERAAQDSIDAFRRRQREAAAAAATEQREREHRLRVAAGLESPEAKPEPVKPADVRLGSSRSDYRGQIFDRKTIKVTIDDPRALPDEILLAPNVRDAMIGAVRQLYRLRPEIPGATIETDQASTVKAG